MVFKVEAQSRNNAGQGRQNYTYIIEISLRDILDNTVIAVNSILYYILLLYYIIIILLLYIVYLNVLSYILYYYIFY